MDLSLHENELKPPLHEVYRNKPSHPHKIATLQIALTLPVQYQGTASARQLSGQNQGRSSCTATGYSVFLNTAPPGGKGAGDYVGCSAAAE